jgi:sulfide:quinone oxidoreductase
MAAVADVGETGSVSGGAGVVIVGGGVTGIEAALALRALAPTLRVRMLSASGQFVLLAASTALAFRPDLPVAASLPELMAPAGVEVELGELRRVDLQQRLLTLGDGREVAYDGLLVAVGGRRDPYLGRHAITFRGPEDAEEVRGLIADVAEAAADGVRTRLVFAVPPGPGWPLPAYELAFLAAAHLASEGVRDRVEIAVVSAEEAPLGLFGPEGSGAVASDAEEAGITLLTGVVLGTWAGGELELLPSGRMAADRVVALPRLSGPRLPGLPADALGFVRADRDGRIPGGGSAFVVGDAGPFPVKQGGIGCAQADRAASLIARDLGADVEPIPFDPALRAFLLEGLEERYLGAHPTGGHEDSVGASWLLRMERMTGKVAGRYLAPYLEARMPMIRLRDPD